MSKSPENINKEKIEKVRWQYSLFIASVFVFAMYIVKITEVLYSYNVSFMGIIPRTLNGLPGIFLCPFAHGNWNHLFDNSVSFFLLSIVLFYFYRELAWRVFLLVWLLTGILVWLTARDSIHIGASGLIYGYAFFMFFSGIFRRYIPLMTISILILFLYGSMVWGLFPIRIEISWESHLAGAISGLALAFYYRKKGPQRKPFAWELEEDEEEENEHEEQEILKIM